MINLFKSSPLTAIATLALALGIGASGRTAADEHPGVGPQNFLIFWQCENYSIPFFAFDPTTAGGCGGSGCPYRNPHPLTDLELQILDNVCLSYDLGPMIDVWWCVWDGKECHRLGLPLD